MSNLMKRGCDLNISKRNRRFVSEFEFFDDVFKHFDEVFGDINIFDDLKNSCSMYNNTFPPVDVLIDKEKNLIFNFALAGYSKDDINLSFNEQEEKMYLELENINKKNEENERFIKKGLKFSSSKSQYYIPASKYNFDKSNAVIENGMLTIKFPPKDEVKPKQIEIKELKK